MDDRKLIELAAKASGITHDGYDEDRECDIWWLPNFLRFDAWNPLTDDGDALRLAVRLNLDVFQSTIYREAQIGGALAKTVFQEWGNDQLAATRRAIVRAAAEIGKVMP